MFAGCWADFYILALHTIISTSAKTPIVQFHGIILLRMQLMTRNLIEHFVVAISNVAPFIKSLSPITSNKLVSLFCVMSLPAYILANEYNNRMLSYVIEAITSLIQYFPILFSPPS